MDPSTHPMSNAAQTKAAKEGAAAAPMALSKTFDSFDATLRLAAMTDQTEDFRDYITATQKMRAYRGKIEPGSPLAASLEKPAAAKEPPRIIFDNPALTGTRPVMATGSSSATNLLAIGVIVILLIAALALPIALVGQ